MGLYCDCTTSEMANILWPEEETEMALAHTRTNLFYLVYILYLTDIIFILQSVMAVCSSRSHDRWREKYGLLHRLPDQKKAFEQRDVRIVRFIPAALGWSMQLIFVCNLKNLLFLQN